MARRQIVVLVVLASVLGAACSGGDAGPPTGWSSRSIDATFGPRAAVMAVAPVPSGFAALGLRYARRRVQEAGRPAGVPRIWTSTDAENWSRISLHGLPRHVPCGWCGPAQLVTRGDVHVLVWSTGDRSSLYRSTDLRHWHHVLSLDAGSSTGVTSEPGGFLASVQRSAPGVLNGERTYAGYRSRDGEGWRRIPAAASPAVSGLAPRARLHGRWLGVWNPTANAEQLMQSTDRRVWTPVPGGPARGFIERGPIASADHRRVGAQAYDESEANARGRFVVSSDGRAWHEVRSFARRFPHADLARVGRVGRWWIVGGVDDDRLPQQQQRWSAWVTRDLRHWQPWTNHGRVGEYDHYYPVAAHGIAFFLGGYRQLVMFNPSG